MNDEIPTYSWFADKQRVSIYADGTVEIQNGKHSYRASPDLWVRAAIELNYSVSHCQADVIESVPTKDSSK